VSRFALKIESGWRESPVVARHEARRTYEQQPRRRGDPALLEHDVAHRFIAPIAIAPHADAELVLAYDHPVSSARPYVLRLAGLPSVPALSIAIDHDGDRRTIVQPGRAPVDLEIPITDAHHAVAGGDAVVATVTVPEVALAPASLDRVLILVDTSASRAAVMGRQVGLLRHLLRELPAAAHLVLATYDHGVTEVYRGPASRAAGSLDAILEHGALGASDLGEAVARAAASGMRRVILIGDGAPSLGEHQAEQLALVIR
jgi:hypothetical protein